MRQKGHRARCGCITVDNEGRIITATLNRPRKRNSMNPQLNDQMLDDLTRLAAVKVVAEAGGTASQNRQDWGKGERI